MNKGLNVDYKKIIRDLPDYPVEGVVFKDITTLWKDKKAFSSSMDDLMAQFKDQKIDKVIGVEARGFIMASVIAYKLGAGFIPVRKKTKLPWKTYSQDYELEYGKDHVEIHQDAFDPGDNVLIADDLLATGGTTEATVKLLKNFKDLNIVGAAYLVELGFLNGRDKLDVPVFSVIKY